MTLPAPESFESVPVPVASTDVADGPLSPLFTDGPPSASADRLSTGAFDAVGSYEPGYPKPAGRPLYPYGNLEYWMPHDADVEAWGDLLELPHVLPGWYWSMSATAFKPLVTNTMTSDAEIAPVFAGNPIALNSAPLSWSVSPELTVGYRYEHGLGEVEMSHRYFGASGSAALAGYDPAGAATLSSQISGNTLDLDYCVFEFNPEGTPWGLPLLKVPGRLGMGKPQLPGWFSQPLEMRFLFGGRGANLYYATEAAGPSQSERVMTNLWGGGIHFLTEIRQMLAADRRTFLYMRAEGAGIWGTTSQTFSRTGGTSPGAVSLRGDVAVPMVEIEAGLSYAPNLPTRDVRFTVAYFYDEWFRFADAGASDGYLVLNGITLRMDARF